MTKLTTLSRAAGIRVRSFGLGLHTVANRVRSAVISMREDRSRRVTATPTLAQRQDDLGTFYAHFECLVEALCDAAQYGPEMKLERRYAELRSLMQREYPGIRPFVSNLIESDAHHSDRSRRRSDGTDAFESLFSAPTLAELLRCDDGELISRIISTRAALSRYGDELRRISA